MEPLDRQEGTAGAREAQKDRRKKGEESEEGDETAGQEKGPGREATMTGRR